MLLLIKPRSSINLCKGSEVDLALLYPYFYYRVTMTERRGRKQRSEDKDEEWTVKKPKAKQTCSHVCVLLNTR